MVFFPRTLVWRSFSTYTWSFSTVLAKQFALFPMLVPLLTLNVLAKMFKRPCRCSRGWLVYPLLILFPRPILDLTMYLVLLLRRSSPWIFFFREPARLRC